MQVLDARTTPRIDEFLRAVDREVIVLGVRDYLDVEALLRSREDWTVDELRASLAAMLACNPEQLRQVLCVFDRHFHAVAESRRQKAGAKDAHAVAVSRWQKAGAKDAHAVAEPRRQDAGVNGAHAVADPRRQDAGAEDAMRGDSVAVRLVPKPAPRPPPWWRILIDPRRWSSTVGLALVTLLLVAIVAAVLFIAPPAGPGPRPVASSSAAAPTAPAPAAAPAAAPAPARWPLHLVEPKRTVVQVAHRPTWLGLQEWASFLMSGVLLIFGIRWWLVAHASVHRRKVLAQERLQHAQAARRELARESAERGDPVRVSYRVPEHIPIPSSALDDVAALLGRAPWRERGTDLDVAATLRATLAEAGRFVPIFEPRHAVREILVLLDVERGDHPWLAGFQRTLDQLRRRGVAVVRYRFQHTPAWLSPQQAGPPISLEQLSRRFAHAALVVFSRRLTCRGLDGEASWTQQLAAWPLKVWIDPDPRPLEERIPHRREIDDLERLGLRRFPWTKQGLMSAATYLARDGEAVRDASWPELPSLDDPAVNAAMARWALCAALVPDAGWDQLEAIRCHKDFAEIHEIATEPWCLQRLLDWVALRTGDDPESGDGRTLQISPELIDQLICDSRARREIDASKECLESRAHRLLLEQLGPERPEEPLQQLRWDLKYASHELVLYPDRALELAARFFGTAVEQEARHIVDAELRRQRSGMVMQGKAISKADIERLQAFSGDAPVVELRELVQGHGRLYLRAAALAAPILLAVAASVVMGLQREWAAVNLRRGVVIDLAPTYKVVPSDRKE
ncbi:hypothetical protein [Sorangium sp. So ce861]|uniref:hypothetical protein n=1 Tax=Sorangium sp. So ce861 TaxID=3133323 RepID=UPI003F60626B